MSQTSTAIQAGAGVFLIGVGAVLAATGVGSAFATPLILGGASLVAGAAAQELAPSAQTTAGKAKGPETSIDATAPPERIIYKVNTVLGLSEAVECGIGIGPLPCFIADSKPDLIRLTPPIPEFSTGLWLLTHPDLRQSARVRVFLDFIAAEVAKQRRAIEGEAMQVSQGVAATSRA